MRPSLIIVLLVGLLALPAAFSARRWTAAKAELAAAQAQLLRSEQSINRIHDLRSRQQQVETHQKPKQAIIAQVNAVLATIGVDQSVLAGVMPMGDKLLQQDGTAGPSPYHTQSVQITLRELTVQDAARFLQHWRQAHPIWQPVQIQLTHARGREGNSDRFDLTTTLRAVYLATGSSSTGI